MRTISPLEVAKLNNQYLAIYGVIDGRTHFLPDGVTLNPTPTYVNDATGTVQIKDSSGNVQVIGPSGATSAALAFVAATNGNYRALITSDFNPAQDRTYIAIVDMTAPGGLVAHWEIPLAVRARTQ